MRMATVLLAASTMALAGPVLADPGSHGGGSGMGQSMGGGMGVGMNAGGFGPGGRVGNMSGRDFGAQMSTDARAMHDARSRTDADVNGRPSNWRANSQGPAHASATGIAHANSHSVLAGGTTVVSGPLTGLTVGMSAVNSNGQTFGTVQRIVTSKDGTIRKVLVQSSDGSRIYPLGTSGLSLSGGTLVTTRM